MQLIFEKGRPGRKGANLPKCDVPEKPLQELIPARYLRSEPAGLPELSEPEVLRHFINLSRNNYGIDLGFYPLGSCSMKHNPRVHELIAAMPGFSAVHPLQPVELAQGALRLMFELGEHLKEIGGMAGVTLQPAAGAHGELAGMMMIRAYHRERGDTRTKVLIPDSAHGTNPASAALAGYRTEEVKSNAHGTVDLDDLKKKATSECAALMLTNPNTLGLFEKDIVEIKRILDDVGALLYMDGANLNALVGLIRPGDMGFDVVHFNLHKTFTTPHGGGGPGAGPVGVSERLLPYLPVPTVEKSADGRYSLKHDLPRSIGRLSTFYGNFGIMVRAYAYIRTMGAEGLKAVSENAVINANYMMAKLKDLLPLAYQGPCMHEFVLTGKPLLKETGVHTRDVAKRIIDFGFHPPTVYFPLVVDEAIMIEPTETETKETLDAFCDALAQIVKECRENPEHVITAPHTTPVGKLDETKAVKELNIKWIPPRGEG
ncbi:MAG: aminomethyl-transferring glycine dehydrogenase subunit GcvPB [Nitrospirota bacterium]|nr:aminomethyl-transferring glycine dehydrogenase subunit GcvPB [Nitrospirota bacterium]